MELWKVIVLGALQGLTEFLPVSSTAHLRIVPALLGWEDPGAAVTAVLQLGSLLALFLYFWKDCKALLLQIPHTFQKKPQNDFNSRLFWAIFLGSIPIGLTGYCLRHLVKDEFRSLWVIAIALIVVAFFLWVAEKKAKLARGQQELRILDGIWMGCAQCLALIPGVSRSGISMVAGLELGFTREAAARFSFLLGIPALLAAGVFELWQIRHDLAGEKGWLLLVGTAVAAIVSYLAIDGLLRFLKSHSTRVFIGYRILLGLFLIFCLWQKLL